jgi:hypothetical protein
MSDEMETTMTRALSDAERASIAAAAAAFERGDIEQRETSAGSGVWTLVRPS